MISSCSPWIVATMSLSRPVRTSSSAAISVLWPRISRPSSTTVSSPPSRPADSPNSSSSMASSWRPRVAKWRRRTRPIGCAAGGPVEGLGHGGPPVDDQGLALLVGHRQAADVVAVAALAAGAVDAAEHEAGVAQLQGGQPLGDVALDHLPLPPGLLGAALADLHHRPQAGGLLARALEAGVGVVDVGLLGGQVGMGRHRSSRETRGLAILPDESRPSEDRRLVGMLAA